MIAEKFDKIYKPFVDKREYRGLVLKNKLRVLLVADPDADKSAASMDVRVGHLSDPWELPGLAHFCEHMLFLGTEKYPSENEYSRFLSANAGSSNAYTSSDSTNYHFDVKPDQLEGALDRFVQFFLGPQFTESATEREVCAVDSEHSNNIQNDGWRVLQVEKFLSLPGHDFGKFGTGNKQTLLIDARAKGIEPRDALLAFHDKYYSSNIMALTIVGKNTLDELEAMVTRLGFNDIVDKNVTPNTWDQPYGPEQCGRIVQIVPIKDSRTVTVVFPMDDLTMEYKSNSVGYLSHLIGHEGEGSLLSCLKKKGWATALTAGYRPAARGFGAFKISIELSIDGLENVNGVIMDLFHAVATIRQSGPQQWIFDEIKNLRATEFMFKDSESPMKLAIGASCSQHDIPFEDILSNQYIIDKFEPDRVRELTEELRPSNMLVRVVAKQFADLPDLEKEPVYGTEMKISSIDPTTMREFERALSTPSDLIRLPTVNEFIPTKFDLKPRDINNSSVPRLVRDDKWARVWFKQDDEFMRPKLITMISINCPMVSVDSRSTAIASLMINCLDDALIEEVYNPELAGLKYQFEVASQGFFLKVRGYDEKLPLFVHDLLHRFVTFKPDRVRFEVLKEAMCRRLKNFAKSQPYLLAQNISLMVLIDRHWSKEQLLAVANDITFEDIENAVNYFLQAFHVEMFVHGNSTEEETLRIAEDAVVQLRNAVPNCRPLFSNEILSRRETDLGAGSSFVYRHPQSTHALSCVEAFFQTGKRTTKENALVDILAQIVNEPAFNVLRTNEQLGYLVGSYARRSVSSQGLELIVQGPKDPDDVIERIEAFVESIKTTLTEMSDESFREHVEAVITTKLEKPKTLHARFRRFWEHIDSKIYHFTRDEDEVAILRCLNKDDLINYFNQKISRDAPERKQLVVFVHPANESKADVFAKRTKRAANGDSVHKPRDEIHHIELLRSRLGYYGFPEPAIDLPPIGAASVHCDNDDECVPTGDAATPKL